MSSPDPSDDTKRFLRLPMGIWLLICVVLGAAPWVGALVMILAEAFAYYSGGA